MSKEEIGLTFQGFFDSTLKDIIKNVGYSSFDYDRKAWIIPREKKQDMVDAVKNHCLENNIMLGDTPKFVE